ncbi:lycopene cyclase domain-containing protein [Ruania alkalisoli]|uniref:Lycopene cyclase domain-containing protein n=1 Tax=Ruania alkalisoli TaxID=2779775 RepID=A0A7M1SVU1_9MICO|nr:lycopene cyclase domain-containing protein [Ruania alkalisoli]QOR71084.1 lycopene cyclase domain-containing protein [Ruania alkalisoli]
MTYLGLALVVLALAAVFCALTYRGPWRHIGLLALVLVVLTAVFDNVMIAADLFGYADDHTVGVRVGLAPIEDFAWPLVAAMVVPGLWSLAARAGRDGRTRRGADDTS